MSRNRGPQRMSVCGPQRTVGRRRSVASLASQPAWFARILVCPCVVDDHHARPGRGPGFVPGYTVRSTVPALDRGLRHVGSPCGLGRTPASGTALNCPSEGLTRQVPINHTREDSRGRSFREENPHTSWSWWAPGSWKCLCLLLASILGAESPLIRRGVGPAQRPAARGITSSPGPPLDDPDIRLSPARRRRPTPALVPSRGPR